jgi:hypothetical protein
MHLFIVGAKKSGKKAQVTYSLSPAERTDHIPSTQNYPVEEVMLDLLHAAARLLVRYSHCTTAHICACTLAAPYTCSLSV